MFEFNSLHINVLLFSACSTNKNEIKNKLRKTIRTLVCEELCFGSIRVIYHSETTRFVLINLSDKPVLLIPTRL